MFQSSMWIVIVVAVLVWSAVLTALGQTAAVGALVPSLGVLVHQISQAVQAAGNGRAGRGERGRSAEELATPGEPGQPGPSGSRGQEPPA